MCGKDCQGCSKCCIKNEKVQNLCVKGLMNFNGAVFAQSNPGKGVTGSFSPFPLCDDSFALPQDNEAYMFRASNCGILQEIDREQTGGLGTGPGLVFCEDPFSAQGPMCVSTDKKFLFTVNAGDPDVAAGITGATGSIGTVSSLRIYGDKLKLADNVSSEGVYPNSCSSYGNLLYVLNGGGDTNLAAFQIQADGKLKFLGIKDTYVTVSMSEGQIAIIDDLLSPSQVKFNANGTKLFVGVKNFPLVGPPAKGITYVYDVLPDGNLANKVANISAGYVPWGFEIVGDYLFVTEVLGQTTDPFDPIGKGAVSSYKINSDNTLTTISVSVPNFETAPCWTSVIKKYLYVANSRLVPGTISKYEINFSTGQITLSEQQSAVVEDSHTVDLGVIDNHLYIVCPGNISINGAPAVNGTIKVFKSSSCNGKLKFLQSVGSFQPISGMEGIATVKFDC